MFCNLIKFVIFNVIFNWRRSLNKPRPRTNNNNNTTTTWPSAVYTWPRRFSATWTTTTKWNRAKVNSVTNTSASTTSRPTWSRAANKATLSALVPRYPPPPSYRFYSLTYVMTKHFLRNIIGDYIYDYLITVVKFSVFARLNV